MSCKSVFIPFDDFYLEQQDYFQKYVKVMSRLNQNFLFGVAVLVATLQSAKSRRQSQLADNKDPENQFSHGSFETKEGKERHNKEKISQRPIDYYDKSSLTNQSLSSSVL